MEDGRDLADLVNSSSGKSLGLNISLAELPVANTRNSVAGVAATHRPDPLI